ncbi:hypothetical protein CWI84_03175 [Idiomarina tyrosinivorans]|uniref:YkgJ family cysteine cluster protein n=1 Tax=Idiomarina tyrosinivorans TaxID=1445662 RepID=A0A432ZT88_9GAMM|nr:YkgJ family cysteine cluster protein [Idiomarina tyrosinivorans]RUO81127.1 hypothetical protein CWI84_03175 [Idiomarina tyrosinivorans]
MQCRVGCGACCIAPSISSPIPDMPHGKPAGVHCVHLTDDHLCALFGLPSRPKVCEQFDASEDSCGDSREQGLILLTRLEQQTT